MRYCLGVRKDAGAVSRARPRAWGIFASAMCVLAAACAGTPKPSVWVGHIGFGPEAQ